MDKIVKGYPNWDIPLNANIDEYNATMGNAELSTEDKTIKGAINEIKSKNDETIGKIKDDTQINTADISNLKTSVAQNTSSLNAKANKSNAEFTGYIKLNNNYVADYETKNMTLLNGWTLVDGSIECIRVGKVGFINLSLKSGVTNPSGSTQVLELPFYSKHNIMSLTGYGEMNNINVTISGNQVHVWGIGSSVERLPINIPIPLV